MKISEQISAFLSEADVQANSRYIYAVALRKYFLWVKEKEKDHQSLTKADIIDYKNYLQKKDYTTATVKNYFTVVSIFYRWADMNNIHDYITQGVRPPKYDNAIKKMPLTEYQVSSLFAQIDRSTSKGKRDYAIFTLLLSNGLRRNELTSINIGDIREEGGRSVIYILEKNQVKKETVVQVTDNTMEAIHDWLLCRGEFQDKDPLFTSMSGKAVTSNRINNNWLSTMIKGYFQKIGLDNKKYSCHSLRHTAATILIESGYDLHEVQLFLRHKSANTTALYTRVIDERIKAENKAGKTLSEMLKKRLKK